MKCWIITLLSATVAAFSVSAAVPCIENRQDLLRYPLQLTLPSLEPSDLDRLGMYNERAWELELYREWGDIGTSTGMDLATYTAHLQEILHGQGIRTTLETPEEGRNTLTLESVAPGGNPLAQCYLDLARATEVRGLVVHLTEVDYREGAGSLSGDESYFLKLQRELGLSLSIVLDMVRGYLHPYTIHEFRHAAFSAEGEHSFFNHAFLRMDSPIDLLGNRADSVTRNLQYREYFSVEEVYNFAFDAIFYLNSAMHSSTTTTSSSYNWQEFGFSIFVLEAISGGVTELAAVFLEKFQNSPINIRAIEDKYVYLFNYHRQVLRFKVSPATLNIISNALSRVGDYDPDVIIPQYERHRLLAEYARAQSVWEAEVESSLGKIVTLASFVQEKTEHILELLESEPDNHRAIKESTEELVFFLQDQLFSDNDRI